MKRSTIRQRIADLELGQSAAFDLKVVCYSTLRSYSYSLSVETGNRYSTSVDRETRTLTITRTA